MGARDPQRRRGAATVSAGHGDDAPGGDEPGRLRLDKWLWAARFFRTRALAARAIESGKVELAGDRTKPSRSVRPGDRIRILRGGLTWDVRVTGLSDRRGSARQAALLYSEGPESIAARTSEIERARSARAEAPPGRPTKRQRRRLEDFLSEP